MIQLASSPMPHVTSVAQSVLDMFRAKNDTTQMHRPIPAPEPSPEPNPAPDAVLGAVRKNMAPEDWDELFHAIQTRLENCVGDALEKAPELPLHDRHEVTKKTVLECVESMQQLHRALTLERQAQQRR